MNAVFDDGHDVRRVVAATLSAFLASDDGARVSAAVGELGDSAVLELRTVGPECTVWVDFAARTLLDDAPDHPPVAVVTLEADALHHLLLDQLGPVEISRLAEENRVALEGPPLVLGALLPVVAAVQPHYRSSLEAQGLLRLLDTPAPVVGEIWETDEIAPPVIGVRRPWQRPRSGRATGVA
jgi:hypothetical protein